MTYGKDAGSFSASPPQQNPLELVGDLPIMQELLLEALFEKDRLSHMGTFIHGLIHNINGPLQNISMLVEMLSKGHEQLAEWTESAPETSPESWEAALAKQQQRFQWLSKQVAGLVEMVRDFMVVQEIEQNESQVDLRLLLNKLAGIFRADLFFKHQIEIELQIPERLPLAQIHGRDLIPALMHVFQNALEAVRGASEKKIVIECRHDGDALLIIFRDSGSGLCVEEEHQAWCDLFFSGWPEVAVTPQHAAKHFGFGLYAVRSLLERHGGGVRLLREEAQTSVILRIPAAG